MSIKQTIQEAIDTGSPVIVDYWKDGCAPCKAVAMHLAAIEKDYPDIKIFKIKFGDSEEGDALFNEHNLKTVPSLFLYNNKDYVTTIGAAPKSKILDYFGIVV